MTKAEDKELDKLLDLLENGIPIDGRHPGRSMSCREVSSCHSVTFLEGQFVTEIQSPSVARQRLPRVSLG